MRLAEGVALGGVVDRPVDDGLGDERGADGLRQPLLRELRHHVAQSRRPSPPSMLRRGNADVLEEQLGRVLRVHAELFEVLAAAEARAVALDQEQRDALGAGRLSVLVASTRMSQS